ncbi:MAG TPA: hypothetical protein VGQ57_14945 [Polyangiaceae bacterium]|jgi:hypothetical protein|nr:hypothetical protein [Polyangiaceae bacterium]
MRASLPSSNLLAIVLVLAGCGSGAETSPPPSTPESTPVAPAPLAAAPAAADSAASSPAPSAAPAQPPAAAPEASADAPPPSDAPRDVKFIQTPEGLRVEVLGVKFVPKVETVRTQAGFDVKLTVSATAGEPRSLLTPKAGPFAFAGVVKRAGKSDAEQFGDERQGDGEQPLGAGTTVKLSRTWPGTLKVHSLGNGDVLELDVALWGLGTQASDRRAVKQFLRVKAKVEHWKASARIEPPPSVKGKS